MRLSHVCNLLLEGVPVGNVLLLFLILDLKALLETCHHLLRLRCDLLVLLLLALDLSGHESDVHLQSLNLGVAMLELLS